MGKPRRLDWGSGHLEAARSEKLWWKTVFDPRRGARISAVQNKGNNKGEILDFLEIARRLRNADGGGFMFETSSGLESMYIETMEQMVPLDVGDFCYHGPNGNLYRLAEKDFKHLWRRALFGGKYSYKPKPKGGKIIAYRCSAVKGELLKHIPRCDDNVVVFPSDPVHLDVNNRGDVVAVPFGYYMCYGQGCAKHAIDPCTFNDIWVAESRVT